MTFYSELLWLLPITIPGLGIMISLSLIDMGGESRSIAKARFWRSIFTAIFFLYLGVWWLIFTPPGLRFETDAASRIVGIFILFFGIGYVFSAIEQFQKWRHPRHR